ncbi:endonuclease III [Clostridium beijerinckii]|uniref:endonuclease III n=1 Tax=Clostridium beijerinckii TaxID=1520 RepID=UPI00098BFEEA|nr:endonuclease III [Clostridium beijerinckii]MBA8937541.1 endonuclease-3 [Clostridium beijerinckii]NRU41367.1 endonuclease-3 [Clostridium beijerinckii]NSA95358.1 endonuclease-3 [Clostridium beijerinckii]OOM60321.1 ultraviolet N-glycosylase/AP lyase [Clostridium beijerinckii]OOM71162.1 ultraviolet N-glycosylase/AP lyase [Clostridium beijerinckii]
MKARTKKIVDILKETYPDAKCELNYETPLQLLIATILSAQTTDKKVNEVTKDLFRDYPDLDSLLTLTNEELEERIKQIGLYRNKSKNLILMFNQLKEKFNGEVPKTMEEITSLAGAGRKTANVVLSNAFNMPSIAVDTHVFRVSNRLKLADSENVLEVEKQLQKELPKKEWTLMHHLLIFHGRRCCSARNPKCGECPIKDLCSYDNKTNK